MINKRDKVIYYHVADCTFTLENRVIEKNQILYVGSGNYIRSKSKANRSKHHLAIWDNLRIEIAVQGLTVKEAEKYEQRMLDKYWALGLLNRKRTVDVKKDYIYEELYKLFYIDSDFNLRWKVDIRGGTNFTSVCIPRGTIAGCTSTVYKIVSIKRVNYQVHRIIWCLHNKANIEHEYVVDHIDRNPLNNNPLNLRVCSQYTNQKNKTSVNKTTGIKYISYFEKCKLFQVQIIALDSDGVRKKIGKIFRLIPLMKEQSMSFEDAYKFQLDAAKLFVASQDKNVVTP